MAGKGVGGSPFKREQELTMLPDAKLKISAEHFRRVVRRIESIRPEQDGKNAPIIVVDNKDGAPGRLIKLNAKTIELTACINGEPGVIKVYGPSEDEESTT